MDRIGPYGIVAHIGIGRWLESFCRESQLFTTGVLEVTVHVLQGKDAISAGSYAFNTETPMAVRACHALQRDVCESRIVQV